MRQVERCWRRMLYGFWDSDLALLDFRRQNGLKYRTAQYWRRKLEPGVPSTPAEAKLEIIPVPLPEQLTTRQGIHMRFHGGEFILDPDFDEATLRRILDILEVH